MANQLQHLGNLADKRDAHLADHLLEKARVSTDTILTELQTRPEGLSEAEAASCLRPMQFHNVEYSL